MNITVVGTGYVGLVSGVCYAELGNRVVCVDKDAHKIMQLERGEIPIYEPGLKELADANVRRGRLSYTSDLHEAMRLSELVIIAVGTPPLPSGEADMRYIESVAAEIGEALGHYQLIVIKSTVPVGTNEAVRGLIAARTRQPFEMASVPEFLREGSAVQDTLHPDRIVIGADSSRAAHTLQELHRPLTDQLIVTDIRSAEMIKYASNAFLATKISFINEIANICEKVGADVTEVAGGMGLDRRIGAAFLRAGIGYGGSCFPKDTKALIQIAGNVAYDFKLLKSVVEVNHMQRFGVIDKLLRALGHLQGRRVAIWGLAFKPETDDVRDAPAIEIIERLLELGATPVVHDPIAMPNFRRIAADPRIVWCEQPLDAVRGADALCLLTEWSQYLRQDLREVERAMARPILIDGRNAYSAEQLAGAHFAYYPVGRPAMNNEDIALHELI
ncbi:UDP-glucose/GDP-mannose dehydrogenase family protein [Paenibacillus sp. IB182496]|uniref:UDP-glucose 6-dehydrogenase n=1 Tax=Paenibacillus sabuli TaxID=2772509 RepID=A0A927BSF8_9BACL|nr:UDP-glucose/GDP-mannose dehydrogenase family protein [Paenibacillus sabuli]MBD2845937.1 UDP-glucose/GDP-mannose dehydrogenase family protein [Paenibacillus sabuli]